MAGSVVKQQLFRALDGALRTRGMKIVGTEKSPGPFSMEQGPARARTHAIPIGTVVDIGASDGKWSTLAMKFFPQAHYLLFEPLEERRGELERLRQERPNFDFCLAAAGSEQGCAKLHVMPDLDGSGTDGHDGGTSREVEMTTVDAQNFRNHPHGAQVPCDVRISGSPWLSLLRHGGTKTD